MIVTSSSSSNSYTGQTQRFANRSADMFVLDENQQQERGSSGQGAALAGGDTSFGAKLASMFLVPERPDIETSQGTLDASLGKDGYSQYEKDFMELADKTLAERIRDQYLKDHDLTEDDVNAMSPEDRQAVEDEIRNAILEAMGVNEEKQNIALDINIPVAADIVANSADDESAQL